MSKKKRRNTIVLLGVLLLLCGCAVMHQNGSSQAASSQTTVTSQVPVSSNAQISFDPFPGSSQRPVSYKPISREPVTSPPAMSEPDWPQPPPFVFKDEKGLKTFIYNESRPRQLICRTVYSAVLDDGSVKATSVYGDKMEFVYDPTSNKKVQTVVINKAICELTVVGDQLRITSNKISFTLDRGDPSEFLVEEYIPFTLTKETLELGKEDPIVYKLQKDGTAFYIGKDLFMYSEMRP